MRRELARAAAAVQQCALASDMLRGPIELRVVIDGEGGVTEVGGAPTSRKIARAALTCIRRELEETRIEPVAGEVMVAYVI